MGSGLELLGLATEFAKRIAKKHGAMPLEVGGALRSRLEAEDRF